MQLLESILEEDSSKRVTFIFGRVSCHVNCELGLMNDFLRLGNMMSYLKPRGPPLYHLNITRQALTWLQILDCVVLKKLAVVVSFEDDPITGLPEDIYDGISFEDIKRRFEFGPPERKNRTSHLSVI